MRIQKNFDLHCGEQAEKNKWKENIFKAKMVQRIFIELFLLKA